MSNRNNMMGGCEPLGPAQGGGQPIRAMINELQNMGPEDYRAVIIPLVDTLSATKTSGGASYRPPATHNLVIEQIMGHAAMVDVLSELKAVNHATDTTKGLGDFATSPDVTGRLLMKAMNCRVTLENSDRGQKVIDGGQLNLASILAITGGRTIDWSEKPHIVPAGETIVMVSNLVQTDGKVVGGATEYGLLIVGTLVRVGKS